MTHRNPLTSTTCSVPFPYSLQIFEAHADIIVFLVSIVDRFVLNSTAHEENANHPSYPRTIRILWQKLSKARPEHYKRPLKRDNNYQMSLVSPISDPRVFLSGTHLPFRSRTRPTPCPSHLRLPNLRNKMRLLQSGLALP